MEQLHDLVANNSAGLVVAISGGALVAICAAIVYLFRDRHRER